MVEWKILKVYFQILHPNKAHVPISQHINTLYALNKVSINLSKDGNMKKTLDLTLIIVTIKLMEVFEFPIWYSMYKLS